MPSTRQQATRLFFVALLTSSVTTLYLSFGLVNQYISRPESTVILADASIRYVFLERDQINDADVATPRLRSRETSPFFSMPPPSLPVPTTTIASSPSLLRRTTPYVSSSTASTSTSWHTLMTPSATTLPSSRSLSPRPTPHMSSASRNAAANSSLSTATIRTSRRTPTLSSPSTTISSTPAVSLATAPIQSPSFTTATPDVGTYVSFAGGFADGRGLGNQMFHIAAVIYVAELTGRQPGMLTFRYKLAIDDVFDLGIQRFANLCPCYTFGESGSLSYDSRLEDLINGWYAQKARNKSIFLSGFFQSWKYTLNVERRLRQHFTFRPKIRQFVDEFMSSSRPPGWVAYVRVGVHVRRGDVLYADKVQFGYTTPDDGYFARAMRYFVDRFDRVQFIVACVDLYWCRRNLETTTTTAPHRVNVTYLTRRSRSQDFAVVASCQHVIMSTGTYGWWAAWLAHGITIYYADWPRNGSSLAKRFRREDFFPPNWIGMT